MEVPVFQQEIPFTKASGEASKMNVPFLDIPSGTLLFRGVKLPDVKKGEDPRSFVSEFLGSVEGDRFCLMPVRNVFFYPFPHVSFGANIYGEQFNAILIYQTTRNLRLVCMTSPSKWIRGGDIKRFDGTAPIQRCNKFPYRCEKTVSDETKAWDNCLRPEFAQEYNVAGWMAIADYDSLDNFDVKGRLPKDTAMGKYLTELQGRLPGAPAEILTEMYADARRHRGIPEIVLYPWSPHPGTENQYIDAANPEEAADAIAALADKFNYLPIACITDKGILEAFRGDFRATNLPEGATNAIAGPDARAKIDRYLRDYMIKLMTTGIEIEDLGNSKALYDSRTGFYVMSLFQPEDTFQKGSEIVPYRELLFPLETEQQRRIQQEYQMIFRSFFPGKLLDKETLPSGTVVRRAFVLERPPLLGAMFDDLRIPKPPLVQTGIRSAAAQFQKNKVKKGGTRKRVRPALNEVVPLSAASDTSIKKYMAHSYKNLWNGWIESQLEKKKQSHLR